jgi:S1-C subfamily serine protease
MTTRRILYAFLALLVAAATFFAYPTAAGSVAAPMASYSVKVVLSQGHGSGTHIGDGYIVTAAHVVGDKKTVVIKATAGNQRYADVLWVNKAYDIALLRTSPQGLQSAHLSCRTLHAGDAIRADGNPLNIEFVSSSGKISGSARPTGQHKTVYITDMTTVMGMSGGGLFDRKGDLVGVTSAVAIAPIQTGPQQWVPSLTGFGMAVPSSAVCALMGREVK